ncbi:hypothetical protein GVO57_10050 [Sphingomonas changnyeongensis]|uniref:PilZ domain-containing protein n=1 Tax=Sphingomonas changnyeongensis TaxID=2698679 RepID=A0A7Z2NX17_9SPHN|nr:hypothetical protein GVO57_10050 [Sphingomonas changnyeongensis]
MADKMTISTAGTFRLDDRRSFRHPLAIATRVRELGGANFPIILRNLSAVGFQGECRTALTVPSVIALNLPPLGEVRARVRWVRDEIVGAEFIERLEIEDVDRVLAAAPTRCWDRPRKPAPPGSDHQARATRSGAQLSRNGLSTRIIPSSSVAACIGAITVRPSSRRMSITSPAPKFSTATTVPNCGPVPASSTGWTGRPIRSA